MSRPLPPGTPVTLHAPQAGLPAGTAGVIVAAPQAGSVYEVDFAGQVVAVNRVHLKVMRLDLDPPPVHEDLRPYVQYACVMGSRAFGLSTDTSDTDLRGFYLPPARLHWGLGEVPPQLEFAAPGTEEVYWEARKFVLLALKANPNVLEVLASPQPVTVTPVAGALLNIRSAFLSRRIAQTYGEYVQAQFRRMEADRRTHGEVRPKHVMHLLRLLLSGAHALRTGEILVDVGEHRAALLAVKTGELTWAEADRWRAQLQRDFEHAAAHTGLPDRPDFAAVEAWLVDARRAALDW
ncbi:nucleotidyltransferase domain-containing protein [Deinococcus multiflagellatus]|uniref:nucleotidyltransferase domain-containing protein n=1 Tax=Deinococcus multiflagellatus TaxID=1656887 RepID=UPI001CCD0DB6|nr:nucleotidyltransferase domain-containing protein [Deinococcus multiflagellatus]MBZ9713346.1 nucleotidyltransferase domain-containing protein [Deinococcus multiflagellatus]